MPWHDPKNMCLPDLQSPKAITMSFDSGAFTASLGSAIPAGPQRRTGLRLARPLTLSQTAPLTLFSQRCVP
jgi:hypothetical protein